MKQTPWHLRQRTQPGSIVALTAYSYLTAKALDEVADILLVGDSLAMVLYGEPSTVAMDLDTMIRHGKAVTKAADQACVVVDMPYGYYEGSFETAFANCSRVLKETHANAVKLEGGTTLAPTIEFLTQRGVAVLGHIGLTPQHHNQLGGFKVQGRSDDERQQLLKDAQAIEAAGAFAIVLEGISEATANAIVQSVSIPCIGIGASAQCAGQILVTEDICGINPFKKAKFVKQYKDFNGELIEVVNQFAKEVREGKFPLTEHLYK